MRRFGFCRIFTNHIWMLEWQPEFISIRTREIPSLDTDIRQMIACFEPKIMPGG